MREAEAIEAKERVEVMVKREDEDADMYGAAPSPRPRDWTSPPVELQSGYGNR